MMPIERQTKIISYVNKNNSATIEQLMELVNVSRSTIWRDLKKLEKQNILLRTHGGALKEKSTGYEPLASEKRSKMKEEKQHIASLAIDHIEDGETILLDAGSTTYAISDKLINKNNITVITYDLHIALKTKLKNNSSLIVAGGVRRDYYEVVVGSITENFIKSLTVDKAFLGADAIDLEQGITNATESEVSIKKQIIKSARKTIVVADHTKFGKKSFMKVVDINDINHIIVDNGLDKDYIKKLKEKNIKVEY